MKNLPAFGSLFCAVLALHGLASGETIFDGESLAGWHIMPKPSGDSYHATKENFFVEDGSIVCYQTENRKGGLLLSDATYVDFELELEMKTDWGCDSGIFIRCTSDGQGIQILNDYLPSGNVGGLFGQGTGGYLSRPTELREGAHEGNVVAYDVYDAVQVDGLVYFIDAQGWNRIWKDDDWNRMRIRCVGAEPQITTWINDVKVMEMDGRLYRARHLRDAIEQKWNAPSAWDRELVESITGNAGLIGLQIHPGDRWKPGGSARYRNIRITPVR